MGMIPHEILAEGMVAIKELLEGSKQRPNPEAALAVADAMQHIRAISPRSLDNAIGKLKLLRKSYPSIALVMLPQTFSWIDSLPE